MVTCKAERIECDRFHFLNIISANQFAILCSVDPLHHAGWIVLVKLFRWRTAAGTFLESGMLATPDTNHQTCTELK